MAFRNRLALLGVSLIGLLAGCSRPTGDKGYTPDRKETLAEIGAMYKAHTDERKKAPRNLADLEPYEPANQHGFMALRDGECVLFWGQPAARADAARTVL